MLTQQEADELIAALKHIRAEDAQFPFPAPGQSARLNLYAKDSKQEFIVDVNRRGYLNLVKRCTYQGRYHKDIILLRLDVAGPEHTNPDGQVLPGTHLHIFREEYADKYAVPIPPEIVNPDDLYQTLIDFLTYFKTINTDILEMQTVI